MVKYAVMASGSGTDFQSAVDAQAAGKIPHGEIVALISNKINSGALARARRAGIPAYFVDHIRSQECIDREIIKILKDSGAEFVFLAGFLKKVGPAILDIMPVYNIHPAIDLGRFGGRGMHGLNVHQAVIDAGESATGATIHRCGVQYDSGAVLMQTPRIAILKTDTAESIQQRVLYEEHKLIPQFLNKLTSEMEVRKNKSREQKII